MSGVKVHASRLTKRQKTKKSLETRRVQSCSSYSHCVIVTTVEHQLGQVHRHGEVGVKGHPCTVQYYSNDTILGAVARGGREEQQQISKIKTKSRRCKLRLRDKTSDLHLFPGNIQKSVCDHYSTCDLLESSAVTEMLLLCYETDKQQDHNYKNTNMPWIY